MDNWIKIQSFKRIHQAELRKDILSQNNINSVIVNEKDSLFLFGDIELFVEEKNEKKAKALINEFNGLTKINSFIEMKPILLFQKVLQDAGIETTIKRKESDKYILGNYELYVNNEHLEEVLPYLTGEKLTGWEKVKICTKVRQTKHYVDLLGENLINSIIIKQRDSEYHLETINIFVKKEYAKKAKDIMADIKGFKVVQESENSSVIEKSEEILAKEFIKAIIRKEKTNFKLLVEESNFEKAKEIINHEIDWVELKTFSNVANALYYKSILETANIPSIIVNEKDSSFLLGEIELLVEQEYYTKAKELFDKL
ncbi:MAG: DUF2007 domain-containing protein [Bacteroidales bacterium]|nr:DUF2007 domain-containing protein [Bacteroidales bacterium]